MKAIYGLLDAWFQDVVAGVEVLVEILLPLLRLAAVLAIVVGLVFVLMVAAHAGWNAA